MQHAVPSPVTAAVAVRVALALVEVVVPELVLVAGATPGMGCVPDTGFAPGTT